jgi:hypothetical protein
MAKVVMSNSISSTIATVGVVQLIQHKYQADILYKKRALGVTSAMDTTSGQCE